MKFSIMLFGISLIVNSTIFAACKYDRVKENFFHGTAIILSNRIPWQIDRKDRGSTTLWLKGDRVIVCSSGTIKHLYYGDCVGAKRIR